MSDLIIALGNLFQARAAHAAEPDDGWLWTRAQEAEDRVETLLGEYVDARIAAYLAAQGKEQP